MKITGCIVTYNNRDVIQPCIESLLKYSQTYPIELYISDNGSMDGTIEYVIGRFPQVKILRNQGNLGFGKGHNRVLEQIDSEYHFVINPDITITEDVVAKLSDYLNEHPRVAMVTPRVLNPDGSTQHLPKREPTIGYVLASKLGPFRYLRKEYTRENEIIKGPVKIEFCTGCFFAVRTRCFKEAAGFDDRYFMYFEDCDLSKRIRLNHDIVYHPAVSVIHEWHRENVKSMRGVRRWLKSMIQYFNKWGWKLWR